jgi:hypothetical protein
MGLLDDAIREHLELKRRRGADPGEVAQQERAALEPGYAEEAQPSVAGDDEPVYEDAPPAFDEAAPALEEPHLDPAAPLHEAAALGEPQAFAAGQETAEFDMESILEADVHEGHQGDQLGHEAIHPHAAAGEVAAAAGEELIEWETPVRPGDQQELPEQIPGQERLSFE